MNTATNHPANEVNGPAGFSITELAGTLHLVPGAPVPHNLRSTRRTLAPNLAKGKVANTLPALLGSLFNLCGQAHRMCSHLALEAAAPGMFPLTPTAQTLQRETAVEHVRRIGLDWTSLLASAGTTSAALDDLRDCPLLKSRADAPMPSAETLAWLQARWLNMPPETWLRNWLTHGASWLSDWSRRANSWLAHLLQTVRAADISLALSPLAALQPHGHGAGMQELGLQLASQEDVPEATLVWKGRPAHTGTWSRLNLNRHPLPSSAWPLLGFRIAELIRLCLPDEPGHSGAQWLSWGAMPLGSCHGMAWVEMARGLLIHYVRLSPSNSGRPCVAHCQVLAPTDWNFHPEGVAAQALAQLPLQTGDPAPRVRLLTAALDPCVPFRLEQRPPACAPILEPHHA